LVTGYIRRDPPRLVFGEQLGRRAPAQLVLEIDVGVRSGEEALQVSDGLLAAHPERKASLSPMGIHRDRPPMNAIAAR
jgi:hypothetical protein